MKKYKTFKAFKVFLEDKKSVGRIVTLGREDLDKGDVLLEVKYSSVNYKDALAGTGQGKILKKFPLVPGIDMSGIVLESSNEKFKEGDQVLITGLGFGESHDGGYSELARVPASWVLKLPKALSLREAMIFGTAGFTAALCLYRMEKMGQKPQNGSVVVTGASGGVGSFAIQFLAHSGYQVVAVSGKARDDQVKWLKSLGASEVISPDFFLKSKIRILDSSTYGGLIDNVGGLLLSALIPRIHPWGNVACVGLAGGFKLESTVMPFILRGVSLLGISSTQCPFFIRKELWKRLSLDLKPKSLESLVSQEIGLDALPCVFKSMLERKTKGRTLVRVSN